MRVYPFIYSLLPDRRGDSNSSLLPYTLFSPHFVFLNVFLKFIKSMQICPFILNISLICDVRIIQFFISTFEYFKMVDRIIRSSIALKLSTPLSTYTNTYIYTYTYIRIFIYYMYIHITHRHTYENNSLK